MMKNELQIAFGNFKRGNYAPAWDGCQKIIRVEPTQPDCLAMLGMMCNKAERYSDAVNYLQKCLLYHPHKHVILTELATSLIYLEQYSEAEENLTKSIAFNADYQKTYIQFGKLYKHTNRKEEAIIILRKLISKNPQSASALNNLGTLLVEDENDDEALACFEKAVEINFNIGIAHKNIGLIALKRGQNEEAEKYLIQALKLLPNDIDLAIELSRLWFSQLKLEKVKRITLRALKNEPENIDLLMLSANADMQLNNFDKAIVSLEKVLQIQPENSDAFYKMARCKTDLCDWGKWDQIRDEFIKRLSDDVKKPVPVACSTYDTHYYNIPDSLQHQLMQKNAVSYNELIPDIKFEFGQRSHPKIRIGYISPDFRQHALGMSVYKYFQHHNRNQFEVYAFAVFMPQNTDRFTETIKSGVDHFYDISKLTATDGAKLIYENEIDILIDFGGYTNHTKPGILALKPAPIQIFMMGQPDTTGSSKYDFFLSDSILIDHVNRKYYTENILYHPHGFVISPLEPSEREFTKEDLGIDEDTFVFCCFCSTYKYEPRMFSTWMKILKTVDNSVLWLLGNGNKTFEKNINSFVESHGVAAKRVIISPFLTIEDHLKRMKICDLFLD
ncbi:MAG TPA: tetratricopeptide repeat protein, partial [Prolixibacteraceae bacterium]|nr:tetratricopeptide repeat protein [Prolixibacteraceae bacterium]